MLTLSKNLKLAGITVRLATPGDLPDARSMILHILHEDFGYGYVPEWHWDLDNLQSVYLDNSRQALFVAIDDKTGDVIGTIVVRTGGPPAPPFPQWLADRYSPERTAQLMRVYVKQAHRQRGVGRALVEAAQAFIAAEGGYEIIYLHTNAGIQGAEAFWRSLPTIEVYDARPEDPLNAIHFEINLTKAAS